MFKSTGNTEYTTLLIKPINDNLRTSEIDVPRVTTFGVSSILENSLSYHNFYDFFCFTVIHIKVTKTSIHLNYTGNILTIGKQYYPSSISK